MTPGRLKNGIMGSRETGWKRFLHLLLITGIGFTIGSIIVLASVPPISRDALIHHLAVPSLYLMNGGIYELPSMFFSYFPMNVTLLYAVPLYFGFDIGAKYIHFLFAILTAALIYFYLARTLNKTYGLAGALFFLSIPVIVKLSVTAYVDLGLIFFSWAALYLLLRWHDTGFMPRYLIMAGIACGLALGTKYNGLLLLPIMGAAIPLLYASQKQKDTADVRKRYKRSLEGVGWGIAFILIAMIVFSPWMARNIVWTQNPVYPLYKSVFNPPESTLVEEDKEESPRKNAFWIRRHVYGESFWMTLTIPVRAFFQGQDDDPRYFDGRLNPFLLLFSLIAFIPIGKPFFPFFKTHRNVLGLFALVFILIVFFERDFRIRYMSPAIPPLVILSIFGIRNLVHIVSKHSGIIRKIGLSIVYGLFSLSLLYNGHYVYGQFDYIRPFDYLAGKVDRDTYITRYRWEHPVVVQANEILPKDAQVLFLFLGDRTYYLDRNVHLAPDFYKLINKHASEEDLMESLSRHGTTHIIIDRGFFIDLLRPLPRQEQAVVLDLFKNHTETLFSDNDVLLLELLNE